MSYRSPIGRVRGLGSAKEGTAHWWGQRLTSLALVPLILWFVFSVALMAGADHATFVEWVRSPIVAGLLILLLLVGFKHSHQGMQVVIEDYISAEGAKIATLFLSTVAHSLLALTGVLAVLMILLRA